MTAGAEQALHVVLTTLPGAEQAEALARQLLQERLIACASLVPGVVSLYRWQGALQREAEVLLVMKTPAARLERLLGRVPELHPYDVPEVLALPVEASLASYRAWVVAETNEIGTE